MNKKIDSLIDRYNQQGNLLVITNYPPKGEGIHSAITGGVAGFAKNTLIPLSQKYERTGHKIIVLADFFDRPKLYEEDGMLIIRCWKRNSLKLYLQLLKYITTFDAIKTTLIEFEFASFGDFWVSSFFPMLLLMLRITGKRTTNVLHQVLTDVWSLHGHLGFRFDSNNHKLFSKLLPIYYFLLTHIVNETIVLEEEFRDRLRGIVRLNKVTVIPHGVETNAVLPGKLESRKSLRIDPREFVLLTFGFITWYKGIDLIIKTFANVAKVHNKPVRLIIAGGPSTTQITKSHYQAYYESVQHLVKNKAHITITGFVPQSKINRYFSAADTIVFPYRTMMSSSGPFSMALASGKPLLLSEAFKPYLKTKDMRQALNNAKLNPNALFLSGDIDESTSYTKKLRRSRTRKRIEQFTKTVAQFRSFDLLSDRYFELLREKEVLQPAFKPAVT